MPATPDETSSPCERSSEITSGPFFSSATALGQAVLAGLVVLTAWFFGGVLASVQVWIYAALILGLACCVIRHLNVRWQPPLPLATGLLLLALGLGLFQLIPWSPRAQALLTPAGTRLRAELLPQANAADATLASELGVAQDATYHSVSLYPAVTRHNLVLLLLAVSAFILGASLINSPQARWGFCILIAINGAALAFFGFVQMLTWNGKVFWQVLQPGMTPFATFINRNHAGGFLNLCLAGAVGMLIGAIGRQSSNRPDWSDEDSRDWQPVPESFGAKLAGAFSSLNATSLVAASCLTCIAVGVICSLSRGAILSMFMAAVITAGVMLGARLNRRERHPLALWPAALFTVAVLGLIQWVGMADVVQTRLGTLLDRQKMAENRLPHWRDSIQAVPDYWLLGSGFGTYRYIYQSYSHHEEQVLYHHAENQYLEALVVGGVVGFGLILLMIVAVSIATWRLIADPPDPKTYAFAVAGIFALSSQVVHSFFDFGLYMPANMILLAAFCGAICVAGARRAEYSRAGRFRLCLSPAVVLVLFAGSIWGLGEIRGAATLETALAGTRMTVDSATTPEELLEQIQTVDQALAGRADDAEAQLRAAELWIDLYRVRAVLALEKDASGVDREFLWYQTAPEILHGRIYQMLHNNFLPQMEILRCHHLIQNHLRKSLEHLVRARLACPIMSLTHLRLAQLCGLVSDPTTDGIHLARVRTLAPANAAFLFRVGLLESQAGRMDLAIESWRRCLTLAPRRLQMILPSALAKLSLKEVIDRVIPESPSLLLQLAKTIPTSAEYDDTRLLLAQRAEGYLSQADMPDADREYMLGQSLHIQKRYSESTEHYLNALNFRPDQTRWRYELALLFEQQGLLDRAHEQIKWCVRTTANNRQYQAMLNRINRALLHQQKD